MSRGGVVRVGAIGTGRGPAEATLIIDPAAPGARVEWLDREHAILAEELSAGGGSAGTRTKLVIGPAHRRPDDGLLLREVLIDGWRVEVEQEAEGRAALRDRARRASSASGSGGIVEIRADLPGRVAAVLVAAGEPVVAGQAVVVIEAMKMLNELRAPRAGVVERVAIQPAMAVELGDLLVVLR